MKTITSQHENAFPVITLKYRKGDLIIKEGDYGISIYKIIKGKALVLRESGDKEVALATLGPGDMFGEIAFLNRSGEIRSESVRAIENAVLEVWHPSIFLKEYKKMPPMLKYVTDQVLARLLRMNKLIVQLTTQKEGRKAVEKPGQWTSQKRRYYRKEVDLECHYRPVGSSPKVRLLGRIKDMSLNGLGIEIAAKNAKKFSHMDGDSFVVDMVLPNGKNVDVEARIMVRTISETPGELHLGMYFVKLSPGGKKSLGFFLMP